MATRKTPPPPPQQTKLSIVQMQKGVLRLQKIIDEIDAFDVSAVVKRWGPEQKALEATIDGALVSIFGHGTIEYNRYRRAAGLDHGGITLSRSGWAGARGGHRGELPEAQEAQTNITAGKKESIALLQQAVRWLNDEIADAEPSSGPASTNEIGLRSAVAKPRITRRVFVVHGHDEAALQAVARFLERIEFEAIVLKEQANQGRTIIEKIETHGDVGFAVVLLTPDDVGSKSGADLRPRARQNVLIELGYFMGRLGRNNVCALSTSSDLEIPTDFAGVVWEPFDSTNGWKQSLSRELEASGFEIDWNKVMRA